jgi:hypothetical protein
VRTGAEPPERAREEREREAGVGPRQRGYESSVGAGVGAGEVGAYGREHVGEAVRGGVEGGGLREDGWTRARGQARGDRAASADAEARGHTDAAVPDLRTSGSGGGGGAARRGVAFELCAAAISSWAESLARPTS